MSSSNKEGAVSEQIEISEFSSSQINNLSDGDFLVNLAIRKFEFEKELLDSQDATSEYYKGKNESYEAYLRGIINAYEIVEKYVKLELMDTSEDKLQSCVTIVKQTL